MTAAKIICFDFRCDFAGIATIDSSWWEVVDERGSQWVFDNFGKYQMPEWRVLGGYFENIPLAAIAAPKPENLVVNAYCADDDDIEVIEQCYNIRDVFSLQGRPTLKDLMDSGYTELGYDICSRNLEISYLYTYAPTDFTRSIKLNSVGLLDSREQCLDIIRSEHFYSHDETAFIPVKIISSGVVKS